MKERTDAIYDNAYWLEGLDATDGTPVLDIGPVMTGFSPRGPIYEPQWARDIMASHW